MKIEKISDKKLDYVSAVCLDPSIGKKQREAMQNAMTDRTCWIKKMIQNGLEILVALEKPKQEKIHYEWAGYMFHSDLAVCGWVPKGLLESVPIEFAPEPVKGENQLFIDCMWVLPPFWHSGVAKCLMESFIQDARKFGGASILAYEGDRWFSTSINYLPSSFFKRFGFEEVARDGSRVLLFLDLGASEPPILIYPKNKLFDENDKMMVDAFYNNQCPWSKWMIDIIKINLRNYPRVTLNIINTDERKIIEEFGMSRGIFINGKPAIRRMASWKEIKLTIERIQKEID